MAEAMTSVAQPAAPLSQALQTESRRQASTPGVPRLASLLEISQTLSGALKLKLAMRVSYRPIVGHSFSPIGGQAFSPEWGPPVFGR